MNNPFRSLQEYELFLYTLANNFSAIESSTVTCVREGGTLARIVGEVFFAREFRLVVRERILHTRTSVTIGRYGYEVWRGDENCFGTIHNLTPMTQNWQAHTHTTNTFYLTSNTIACLRPK